MTRKMDGWAHADRNKSSTETEFAELYPTPPEATRALLRVESFVGDVWEPASGLGHISKVFEQHGHRVHSSDLHAKRHGYGAEVDFLTSTSTPAPSIVTNPPYSLLRAFMRHALMLPQVEKVALFTPFEALRVKGNVLIWRELGFPRVHLLMPTLVIDRGAEKGAIKSIFNHAWLVWDVGRPAREITLRHLFWKEHGMEDLV